MFAEHAIEMHDPADRLAVCSWSLEPDSPAALAEALRDLAINRVQLALSLIVRDPAIWRDAIPQLRAAGIQIISGMIEMQGEDYATLESIRETGGVRPEQHWRDNRSHVEVVAKLAAQTGIQLITFHAGFLPEDHADPLRAVMVARLAELCDIASQHGVRLAFETGQESAEALLEVLHEIAAALQGADAAPLVNFDPGNMILYDKGDPVDALQRLGPHIAQIHIKDARRTERAGTWGTEVIAGAGDVDWPRFLASAERLAPPVDYVIERESGSQRCADICAAHELMLRHLSTTEASA